jgi:glycosyltransferase involved in cell wall biosynthesis
VTFRRTAPTLLIVTTVPSTIEAFLLPFARRMRSHGWVVTAAAAGISGRPLEQEFDLVIDLPLSRRLVDPRNMVLGIPAVRRLIETTRPDIVHVHTPIASAVTRVAVRRIRREFRPAVAYTAHGFHFHAGGNPIANRLFQTAERVLGRWTDRLVVINDEDECAALRLRVVPRGRLVRMRGVGIDTAVYSRGQVLPEQISLFRQQIGIGDGTPLFASVAELTPRKRHERSIEALSRMRHADAHLAIAGDGEQRAQLESVASRLGVSDRVHLLGFLRDIRPLLVASTGFVLASGREGLARSPMEALSLEVPVIVSDARGNPELVGSDGGFIVPHADPEGLAQAMDHLIADPDLARRMGQRGRARMVSEYDDELVIDMHERMYAAMLAERAARLRSKHEDQQRMRRFCPRVPRISVHDGSTPAPAQRRTVDLATDDVSDGLR